MAQINTRTWSDDQRKQLLDKFYSSGQTQKEFCSAENICLSTFKLWVKKYSSVSKPSEATSFISVELKKDDLLHDRHQCTLEIGACKLHIPSNQLPNVVEMLVKLC